MSYLLETYKRFPIAFARGQGAYLWDIHGKKYLDFLAGIAVSQLGHAHPRLLKALMEQAERLWGVSNYFEIPQQEALAEALAKRAGLDAVFFGNSGAEANEGLIKLSRLWGKAYRNGAHEIIVMKGSFHGRTMATLSATGQEKVKIGFDPLLPSFKVVPPNDSQALEHAISDRTVAVLVEVIQGEGGVRLLSSEYMTAVRALCDRHALLFMIDEVQTGMGRTGAWFGFQSIPGCEHFQPDAISLAKGLAGGLPIGAAVMTKKAANLFQPGSHASTFGGNPIVCRVALELIQVIEEEGLLSHVQKMGTLFQQALRDLQADYSFIRDVRGCGLIIGCELDPAMDAMQLVKEALNRGFIMNAVQGSTLRFVPPFIIESAHLDEAVHTLKAVFSSARKGI